MNDLKAVYGMLEDELSRELYINRLDWLVTGDMKYVEVIVNKSHPDVPVWNRSDEKTFVNSLPNDRKIIFYGAGSFAERLLPYIEQRFGDVIFCDADADKQSEGYHGHSVIAPEELFKDKERKCVVICTTKYINEVKNTLIQKGIKDSDIIDIRPYFCCGTGDEYFYEDFLHYSEEEIFIDAGCYDGGTTIEFSKICGGLKKVYAFEPDVDNYERCVRRLGKDNAQLPEIVMLPYGTWSCKTELHFNASADGCSHIEGNGDTVVKTAAIDEIVSDSDKVTYIKMDVEGAELESLKGAQTVIRRDKPKLAICIYHKPEDMVTLPLYIKSLVPEYKFYLRSYSNADNEMVLYAIP